MIRPEQITQYQRNPEELQEFLLFCLFVAGKSAKVTAHRLHLFLEYLAARTGHTMPFQLVDIAMNLEDDSTGETLLLEALKKFGLGQYTRLTQAIEELLQLPDLRTVSVERLENVHGIGPKTARFFVVHSRPNAEHAILDTHILKWLRLNGINDAPKSTPQGKWYSYFEKIFLTFVKKSGQSVAEFDLNIWKEFANV